MGGFSSPKFENDMKAQYENHYLSDHDVANFARQSFDRLAEQFTPAQNHNLIRFLARGMATNDWNALIESMIAPEMSLAEAEKLAKYLRSIPTHWVPFGHPHITLRMQAPVPIARQAFKHKIGLVESEESRRYISSEPVLYIPRHFRAAAENVKQGSGGVHDNSELWRNQYITLANQAITLYLDMVADGICAEQARFILPQGCEVHWVWTGSLYAYANFYNQRSDSHAQAEIQQLAQQVNDIIAPLYPVSWAALTGQ